MALPFVSFKADDARATVSKITAITDPLTIYPRPGATKNGLMAAESLPIAFSMECPAVRTSVGNSSAVASHVTQEPEKIPPRAKKLKTIKRPRGDVLWEAKKQSPKAAKEAMA